MIHIKNIQTVSELIARDDPDRATPAPGGVRGRSVDAHPEIGRGRRHDTKGGSDAPRDVVDVAVASVPRRVSVSREQWQKGKGQAHVGSSAV